ncbi:MAG TPA: hypothetical protein VI758_12740, partial [Bacteroidota bacterium]
MNNTECTFMHDVVRAAKTGQWTDVLQTHAANCPMCLETIAVTTMMNTIASQGTSRPLPNHRTIWLKARYARKQERLTRFDLVALAGVGLSATAGLAALFYWLYPQVWGNILDLHRVSLPHFLDIHSLATPAIVLAGAVVA